MKQFKKVMAFMFATLFVASLVLGATSKSTKVSEITAGVQMASVGGAMAVKSSSGRYATVYNILKAKYPNRTISPAEIRVEAYLVDGQAEYNFEINAQTGERGLERKLNQQDAFRVVDIAQFLLAEDKTIPNIGVLQTYPNPVVFPDQAGALQNAHLEHLYNGTFKVRIGETNYIDKYPNNGCRVVNTAQQTSAANRSGVGQGDGYIPFIPQMTLRGFDNNEIKIVVPAVSQHRVAADAAAAFKTKIVLILKGFTILGEGKTIGGSALL